MNSSRLLLAALLMIPAPMLPAQVQTAPVEDMPALLAIAPADRSELLRRDVVLYQGGFGLVEERRRLPVDTREHQLAGLPPTIRPESLLVRGENGTRVTDFVLRALPDSQSLLRDFIGQPVILAPRARVAASERVATLLGLEGGVPIVYVDGRVEFGGPDAPWRIALPVDGVPDTAPLLLRLAEPQTGEIRLSYLADGLGWQASHVVTLDGGRADLQARAVIQNRTGTPLPEAHIALVAGDVASAREQGFAPEMALRAAAADGIERSEAPLGGWQMYRVQGTRDLIPGGHRHVPLFTQGGLEAQRTYQVTGRGDYPAQAPGGPSPMAVGVRLEIPLPEGAPPIPGGVVQVRDRDDEGRLRFLGSDRIDPTPPGTTLSLTLGQAFDVTAQRTQTAYRRLGDNRYEIGWRIEVENTGSQPAVVELTEQIGGDWSLVAGQGWKRPDAMSLTRTLELAPGEREQVEYQVRITR